MEKLKQHYMIKQKEGELHPLFRLAYLPENFASFAETSILFFEGFLVVLLVANLAINIFSKGIMYSASIYMTSKASSLLLSGFGAANVPPNDLVAVFAAFILFFLSRRYFEYVKYNLHMLRAVEKAEDKSNNITDNLL